MLDSDFSRSHLRGLVFAETSRKLGDIQKSLKELFLAKNL